MRLDKAIVEQGLLATRTIAQDYIKDGLVSVSGTIIYKSSFQVTPDDIISIIKKEHTYASRGGIKLYDAIQTFAIDLKGLVVLDIGASTGGFSEVCLQAGASFVYAVDVGHGQLAAHLINDTRIANMEGVNAKELQVSMFRKPIDFVCMDVSFISIKLLFPTILSLFTTSFLGVFLIKPQFEVGKSHLNKRGIVKDKRIHKRLLLDYLAYFEMYHIGVQNIVKASISGRGGNQEYLIYLDGNKPSKAIDINKIIEP